MLRLFHKRCYFTRCVCRENYSKLIYWSMCSWCPPSLRRIRELPLSIPWTLHWGENHRPERNWNREKSQQPQWEALSPQTRLRSGMKHPFTTHYSHFVSPRQGTPSIHCQFYFIYDLIKNKWINHHMRAVLTSDGLIFGMKKKSKHRYCLTFTAPQPSHMWLTEGEKPDAQLTSRQLTEKKPLSSLTFLLSPPLSKQRAWGCFTFENTLYCVCSWHIVAYFTWFRE